MRRFCEGWAATRFAHERFRRVVLAVTAVPNEHEPFFYLGRLLTFGLIFLAVIDKNRKGRAGFR